MYLYLLLLVTLALFSCAYAQPDLEQGTCDGLQNLVSRRNSPAVGTCTINLCTVACTTPASPPQSITVTFFPCSKQVSYIQLQSSVNTTTDNSTVVPYMTADESGNVEITLTPTDAGVDFMVTFIRDDMTESTFFRTTSIQLQCSDMETTTPEPDPTNPPAPETSVPVNINDETIPASNTTLEYNATTPTNSGTQNTWSNLMGQLVALLPLTLLVI